MARPRQLPSGMWRIRWLGEGGVRCSATYPTFREADHQLRKRQAEVEDVRRGLREPTPPDKRFDDLCDYWIERRAPLKRSGTDDASIIRAHLRPAFGHLPLRTVSVAHFDRFVAERRHLSDKTVHNHLTLLGSMLRLAVDLGWLLTVPRIRKPSTSLFSQDYNYLRTKDEVRRFLIAAEDEGPKIHALYATAVMTGMRAGELAGLRWGDIDLDRRLITVQRSFDGPTKSGSLRHVPVVDGLLPVLRQWRLACSGDHVFPNEAGGMLGSAARAFKQVFHRTLDAAGFDRPTGGRRTHHVRFHDLRHTFASHWVLDGGDLFRLQKILGHSTVQMTMRYAHLSPDAFEGDHARLAGLAAPASRKPCSTIAR